MHAVVIKRNHCSSSSSSSSSSSYYLLQNFHLGKMRKSLIFFALTFFLTLQILHGNPRLVRESSNLLSDGVDEVINFNEFDRMNPIQTTTVSCEPVYGFLPCTPLLWGQIFMIVVYEFLLSAGETYVSKGSGLFFSSFGTGLFGASLFQVLGTIPQVALVLVNGITASSSTIETVAAMGMAMLTGSAILSLTITWALVIIFGAHDLSSSTNSETKRPFSLHGYGVTTDEDTKLTARFMLVSLIPFLILQLARVIGSSSGQRKVVLITLIINVIFVVLSSIYQVFRPWMQRRRLEYLMHRYINNNILRGLHVAGGQLDVSMAKELFHNLDLNQKSVISAAELRALIFGVQLEAKGLDSDNYVEKVMEFFDSSDNSNINETEFVDGIQKWINDGVKMTISINSEGRTEEQKELISTKNGRKVDEKVWFNYTKAAFLLALGTTMTVFLARPLMKTLQQFSTSANVPSFFASYVLIPLALNSRQALRAVASAKHKTEKAISLTLSEIYNAVYMKNLMSLMTFLAIVYVRDLSWDVSAEVLVVLVICVVKSFLTSFCRTFPVWTCFIALALYPLSLLLLYVLTSILGWS